MADWQRTSPFGKSYAEPLVYRNSMVTLSTSGRIEKLKVQYRAEGRIDLAALTNITGIPLPGSPRESTGTSPSIFWTSPGEWLMASPTLNLAMFQQRLVEAMGRALHGITDVSDSFAVIELTGARARELLAAGCGVDFHEKQFPVGRYALTRLEQLAVIIHRTGPGPEYRVYVDRPVANYLWEWLKDEASLME